MTWNQLSYRERTALLSQSSDSAVLALAKRRAAQRKTKVGAILSNWVQNGYLTRARKQRIERGDAANEL